MRKIAGVDRYKCASKNRCRILPVCLTGIFIFSFALCVPKTEVWGAETETVDQIEISVGYYGLKSYPKETVSTEDLEKKFEDDKKINKTVYTWIGEDGSCQTTEAQGIYLSDIINDLSISQDDISHFGFGSMDSSDQDADASWKEKDLVEGSEGERYTVARAFQVAVIAYRNCKDPEDYINYPDDYFTCADIFDYSSQKYIDSVWNRYRSGIEPMLALRSKTVAWKKGEIPPTNLDFTGLQEEDAPVLVYGQASMTDKTVGSNMTKKINQIYIWFDGKPKITINESSLSGYPGDQKTISVDVDVPDDTLKAAIESEIRFISSNTAVATVDDDGNVVWQGSGKAAIKAVYDSDGDGKTETFDTVTVTGNEKKEDSGNDSSDGSTSGGSQDQSGSSGGSGNSSGDSNTSGDSSSSGNHSGRDDSGATEDDGSTESSDSSKVTGTNFTPRTSSATSTTSRTVSSTNSKTADGSSSGTASSRAIDGTGRSTVNGTYDEDGNFVPLDNEEADVALPDGTAYEVSGGDNDGENGHKSGLFILFGGGIALVGGAFLATLNYWNQTEWISRAKKLFEKQG